MLGALKRPKAEPQTHDYTRRGWGHDFVIHKTLNGGERIQMSGWGHGLREGDYLILPNGGDTTRYRLVEVSYDTFPFKVGDGDMWKALAEFAPRTDGAE